MREEENNCCPRTRRRVFPLDSWTGRPSCLWRSHQGVKRRNVMLIFIIHLQRDNQKRGDKYALTWDEMLLPVITPEIFSCRFLALLLWTSFHALLTLVFWWFHSFLEAEEFSCLSVIFFWCFSWFLSRQLMVSVSLSHLEIVGLYSPAASLVMPQCLSSFRKIGSSFFLLLILSDQSFFLSHHDNHY